MADRAQSLQIFTDGSAATKDHGLEQGWGFTTAKEAITAASTRASVLTLFAHTTRAHTPSYQRSSKNGKTETVADR